VAENRNSAARSISAPSPPEITKSSGPVLTPGALCSSPRITARRRPLKLLARHLTTPTLHPAPCTIHRAPRTLHGARRSVHGTRYTVHGAGCGSSPRSQTNHYAPLTHWRGHPCNLSCHIPTGDIHAFHVRRSASQPSYNHPIMTTQAALHSTLHGTGTSVITVAGSY
jgi:hypothetical protein